MITGIIERAIMVIGSIIIVLGIIGFIVICIRKYIEYKDVP